jgi:NADH-quinone oxidoreductase subunit A
LPAYFVTIVIFFAVGLALPVGALTVGRWLRPDRPSAGKSITYESGVDPTGDSWIQFHVRYYLFALLFVIFDVETLFLYPWAVAYDTLRASSMGLFVLVEMLLFLFFLVLGLVYAWRRKVLEWR